MKTSNILIAGIFILACSAASATAGSEHAFGRAAGNCGGQWKLPDTGQTISYSTATGDDAHYNPAFIQPAYAIQSPVGTSSVTVDNVTGLMWITNPVDAGINGTYLWDNALTACEGLTYATYSDWRLPNIKELQSIVDYSAVMPSADTTYFSTLNGTYWASTTFQPNSPYAWSLDFMSGAIVARIKAGNSYVRCVRGGL